MRVERERASARARDQCCVITRHSSLIAHHSSLTSERRGYQATCSWGGVVPDTVFANELESGCIVQ
eukprot:1342914-Rhodomonas_salina.1